MFKLIDQQGGEKSYKTEAALKAAKTRMNKKGIECKIVGLKNTNMNDQIDEETRIKQIESRFEILNTMTASLQNGDIRAMIVTGPPGVGKSYGVVTTLEQQNLLTHLIILM